MRACSNESAPALFLASEPPPLLPLGGGRISLEPCCCRRGTLVPAAARVALANKIGQDAHLLAKSVNE